MENDAQRMVTHQVLLAVFDKQAEQPAQPAGAQIPAAPAAPGTAQPAGSQLPAEQPNLSWS